MVEASNKELENIKEVLEQLGVDEMIRQWDPMMEKLRNKLENGSTTWKPYINKKKRKTEATLKVRKLSHITKATYIKEHTEVAQRLYKESKITSRKQQWEDRRIKADTERTHIFELLKRKDNLHSGIIWRPLIPQTTIGRIM